MATFTLSPTPLFGGVFDRFKMGQWDMTELSPGKYLLVYAQTNPDHLVAQVVNLTVGPAFSMTLGTMKHIETLTRTFDFSVIALSATRAIVYNTTIVGFPPSTLAEGRFRVLDIDGSDNITESAPSDVEITNRLPATHFKDRSNKISFAAIDSSSFYMLFQSDVVTSINAGTLTFLAKFNVGLGEVITRTSEDNFRTIMGDGNPGSWNFEDTSTARGATLSITNAFTAGQFIVSIGRSIAIIDGSSTKITDLSDGVLVHRSGITTEIASGEYVNLHPDQFLSFNKIGVWGPIIDYSDPNDEVWPMEAFRLDDTHVMFIQRSDSLSTGVYLQVVRKISDAIWQHQIVSSTLGINPFQTSNNNWWFANLPNASNSLIANGPKFAYFIDSINLATIYATENNAVKLTVVQLII